MNTKKGGDKIVEDCLRILRQESAESTQKWINDNKITSLALRNVKALEVISLSNYILQKMLISQSEKQYQLLSILAESNKRSSIKCYEYSRLVKHFSQWDYEFQYVYRVALDEQLQQLGVYLRVRDTVLHSIYNKGKKDLLSGITAELEDWAGLAKIVFKQKEQEDVIDQFTTVVKQHYVQIKKSQSDKINGAQFLKICMIIDNSEANITQFQQNRQDQNKANKHSESQKQINAVSNILQETILNGLSTQDRQLIRVLSYQDKNIARMLQQKHTKMVQLISEEVNNLRRDINREKQRYIQVVQQKNLLIRLIERLKDSALKYIMNRNESSQFQLLQLLDNYNKKYNPRAMDVTKTTDVINNRRLIEIIQKEELEKDQI